MSKAVQEAVDRGSPVVALESTIFTHGLPRPMNLQVAMAAEELIRDSGATPATIGVVAGVPTVGLQADQIEALSKDNLAIKASTRELAMAVVKGANAGTTIAATALLAQRAGIGVFATGGLGGIHHGFSQTLDESADLLGLASTPIVLVSSGAKAILDIGATLERLETLSVAVVGYRTSRYPGFYLRDSGFPVTERLDSPQEIADLYRAQRSLELSSALLVANPIPPEDELDPAELDRVVNGAWAEAEAQEIRGKSLTPFLLDHIRLATEGRSLEANRALYLNNVRLAVEVAKCLGRGGDQPPPEVA